MTLTPQIMYEALMKKDSSFEGTFYAAVKTTNVFCRPTCTARKPKPEHVEFFSTAKEALLCGYRPCKICKPLEPLGEIPEFIQELLRRMEEKPWMKITDYDLVKQGIEPNKVRRWFKTNHRITFQAYQRMVRINDAFFRLAKGERVTDAAFESGYDSLSGFAEAYKNIVGTSPSDARHTNMIAIRRFTTPLGPMLGCATEDGICLVEFTDRRMLEFELRDLCRRLKARIIYGSNGHFADLEKQLHEYFSGKRKRFDLPLVTPGTEFQRAVWAKLREIPYGQTKSYKQQAIAVKNENAVRAVAQANGMNRISIIVPCHRVIGEDGSLTGYGGGLWRKQWLLDFERNNLT